MKTKELKKIYRDRLDGKLEANIKRGSGYYITLGLLFHDPVGQIWETTMESGKTGVYQLLSYTKYKDPDDMVKESEWCFLGYKDKLIADCTFEEFEAVYGKLFKD